MKSGRILEKECVSEKSRVTRIISFGSAKVVDETIRIKIVR